MWTFPVTIPRWSVQWRWSSHILSKMGEMMQSCLLRLHGVLWHLKPFSAGKNYKKVSTSCEVTSASQGGPNPPARDNGICAICGRCTHRIAMGSYHYQGTNSAPSILSWLASPAPTKMLIALVWVPTSAGELINSQRWHIGWHQHDRLSNKIYSHHCIDCSTIFPQQTHLLSEQHPILKL